MADKKNTAPLKRKVISIETKIQILNRLDNGQTAILTIKKNETVKYDVHEALGHLCISTKFTSRARAPILEKMPN